MRKAAVCFCLLFFLSVFASKAHAQEPAKAPESVKAPPAPEHFYKLNFVLEEIDASGKAVNSRSFSTTVSTADSRSDTITAGTKVPIATGSTAQGSSSQTEFQYIDIGVKIVARDVHELAGRLAFKLRTEVSSLAAPEVIAGVSEPVVRQNTWEGSVLVPIGQATVVSKSDSLDNKGSLQVAVTATPVGVRVD